MIPDERHLSDFSGGKDIIKGLAQRFPQHVDIDGSPPVRSQELPDAGPAIAGHGHELLAYHAGDFSLIISRKPVIEDPDFLVEGNEGLNMIRHDRTGCVLMEIFGRMKSLHATAFSSHIRLTDQRKIHSAYIYLTDYIRWVSPGIEMQGRRIQMSRQSCMYILLRFTHQSAVGYARVRGSKESNRPATKGFQQPPWKHGKIDGPEWPEFPVQKPGDAGMCDHFTQHDHGLSAAR